MQVISTLDFQVTDTRPDICEEYFMKLCAVSFISFILLTSQAVYADDIPRRDFGVSINNINELSVRKGLTESTMIYAGLGYSQSQHDSQNDSSSIVTGSAVNLTTYRGMVGVRIYGNNNNLSKYLNLEVGRIISKNETTTYSNTTGSTSIDYQTHSNTASLTCGMEYFISPNISIEGAAGFGVSWTEQLYPDNSYMSDKSISFPLVNIALTYYW
jgi:hypothetical protein